MPQARFRLTDGRRKRDKDRSSRAGTPTSQQAVVTQGARDLSSNGSISLVGRDNHSHTHFHYSGSSTIIDLESVLRAIPNFRKIHEAILAKATPGTGMWLLKSDKFRIWLEPNGDLRILWGSGQLGSGKTVVAALIINALQALAKERGGKLCVAYVYFQHSNSNEMTVRGILEILVKQVVQQRSDLLPLVYEVCGEDLREGTQPSELQLLALFQRLAECTVIVCVLDALNEAPPGIQLSLVKKLASLRECRLFITLRPLKAVEAHFPGAHSFPITAHEDDLELLIKERLDESTHLRELLGKDGGSLQDEIISSVKQKCGGMFLHASLQLDAICQCLSIEDVKKALEEIPPGLEDVYRRMWGRIIEQEPRHTRLARAALMWVMNARREMTIKELQRAVATCPETHRFIPGNVVSEASLLSLCHGLITVEEDSKLVCLVHSTAKEPLQILLRDTFPHPHALLASACITYLTDQGFQNTTIGTREELEEALKQDPLLAYAYDSWAYHARLSLDVEPCASRLSDFVNGCQAFPVVTAALGKFDIFNPLHTVTYFDLPPSLIISQSGRQFDVPTRKLRYPSFILAHLRGHQCGTHDQLGSPVNALGNNGRSALMVAAAKGHCVLMADLLTHPEIAINLVGTDGWSTLMLAVFYGHEGCIKLLLAHGKVAVNLVDKEGWSALVIAAKYSQERSLELLLAHAEVDVNLVSKNGASALMLAASQGHDTIVKLLLTHPKVKVNLMTEDGWTALMLAAFDGRDSCVKLLLAHPQIEATRVHSNGWSPLNLAASTGRHGTVKLLLAHTKVAVNLVDKTGWSALMLSASHGHEECVKVLVARTDVEVNLLSDTGLSALMLAAGKGHCGIVDLLLAHPKTRVDLVGGRGQTASMIAGVFNHHSVVDKLQAHQTRHGYVNPVI